MRPGARAVAVALALLVAAPSCRFQDLNFREDRRITILSPADRELVELPFELRWAARDFTVGKETLGGDGNYFAVFVDGNPMSPGAHIETVADDSCRRTPGCPDEAWLRDHNVFLTTERSLVVETLPDLDASARRELRELHEITIVLMDGRDRRIGESAFAVEVYLERER